MEPINDPKPLPIISQRKELPLTTGGKTKSPYPNSTVQIRPLSAQARKGTL